MKYKRHTVYENKTWLTLGIIEKAIAENWIDSLCYFVWLKSCNRKPIIYNYSLRKIASLLSCSPSTASFHIALLSKKGLVSFSAHDLHLKSNNDFFKESKLTVPVGVSEKNNKPIQRDLLRFAVIKRNLHFQFRTNRDKNNALKFHKQEIKSKQEYKSLRAYFKKYPVRHLLESSIQNVLTISNQKFGKLTNRSTATGMRLQQRLNRMGLIASKKRVEQHSPERMDKRQFYCLCLPPNYFLSSKGYVWKQLPNTIELK